MKLAVLGGVAAICAATAIVAAQAPATEQTQTVIGCVRGEGTAQAPWVLAGVVIPPPAPAAGRGGAGGGAGRGAGRGAAPGGAPAGGPPAAAPAPTPPPPPPAPIDLRIAGIDLTPWRGGRTQIEGTMGAPGGAMRAFNAASARSVFGTCPNPQ